VEAFKATLEEVRASDFLLHVIDISHPDWQNQSQAVMTVVGELGAAAKPLINVYNKVDKLPHPEAVTFLARRPRSVVVSARTGAGLDDLKHAMAETLKSVEDTTAGARNLSVDARDERQKP
jgi:GTP-binding protein HflX